MEADDEAAERRTGRRALLLGALGLGAAAVSLGSAEPADATTGTMQYGNSNDAGSAATTLTSSNTGWTLDVVNANTGPALVTSSQYGTGVYGHSESTGDGVHGDTTSGRGVSGNSVYGDGVFGQSDLADGLHGHSGVGRGVYGNSYYGDGVYGDSNNGHGVHGAASIGGTAGVWGEDNGSDPTAFGVKATSEVGTALRAIAQSGPAISAQSNGIGISVSVSGSAPALKVTGVAKFSRSGIATVAAGHSSVTVPAQLSTASFVLATPQTNSSGTYVQSVVAAAGHFTIYLNRNAPAALRVGWFIVN